MGNTDLALFQHVEMLREAQHKLADLDMPEEVIRDTLDALVMDVKDKALAVAAASKNLDALADAIQKAEEEMYERRKRLRGRAAGIRKYLLENMQRAGMTKIESPYFQLAVRKNPPSVVVDAPALVPERFWVTPPPPPPAIDKAAVKAAVKAGEDVPGVHLEQSERLDIK